MYISQFSWSSVYHLLCHIQEAGAQSQGTSNLCLLYSRHHVVDTLDCWLSTLAPPHTPHEEGVVFCCISNDCCEFCRPVYTCMKAACNGRHMWCYWLGWKLRWHCFWCLHSFKPTRWFRWFPEYSKCTFEIYHMTVSAIYNKIYDNDTHLYVMLVSIIV